MQFLEDAEQQLWGHETSPAAVAAAAGSVRLVQVDDKALEDVDEEVLLHVVNEVMSGYAWHWAWMAAADGVMDMHDASLLGDGDASPHALTCWEVAKQLGKERHAEDAVGEWDAWGGPGLLHALRRLYGLLGDVAVRVSSDRRSVVRLEVVEERAVVFEAGWDSVATFTNGLVERLAFEASRPWAATLGGQELAGGTAGVVASHSDAAGTLVWPALLEHVYGERVAQSRGALAELQARDGDLGRLLRLPFVPCSRKLAGCIMRAVQGALGVEMVVAETGPARVWLVAQWGV